jgi:hypothetical protein
MKRKYIDTGLRLLDKDSVLDVPLDDVLAPMFDYKLDGL